MASCPPIARHVREREMLDTSRRVVLSVLASQSGSARGQGRSEEERNKTHARWASLRDAKRLAVWLANTASKTVINKQIIMRPKVS